MFTIMFWIFLSVAALLQLCTGRYIIRNDAGVIYNTPHFDSYIYVEWVDDKGFIYTYTVKHEIFACMLFSLYSRFGKIRENFMQRKFRARENFVHLNVPRSAYYCPEILPLQRL